MKPGRERPIQGRTTPSAYSARETKVLARYRRLRGKEGAQLVDVDSIKSKEDLNQWRAIRFLCAVARHGWKALHRTQSLGQIMEDRFACQDGAFFQALAGYILGSPGAEIDKQTDFALGNWDEIGWFKLVGNKRRMTFRVRHEIGLRHCTENAVGQFCAIGLGTAKTKPEILSAAAAGAALVKAARRLGLKTKRPALVRGFRLSAGGWIVPIWTKRGMKWKSAPERVE